MLLRPEFSLHAWVDESARVAKAHPPAYFLGGVVAAPDASDAHREALRPLQNTRGKLHWRDLDAAHRSRVMATLSAFDVYHVVAVGTPMDPRKQERARALCLERLAWELCERHHVERTTLEARTPSLMERDRRTVDALRGRGALPRGMRVEHGHPLDEPMLWIADQVVGAVGDDHVGDHRWLRALAASVEIVRIDL